MNRTQMDTVMRSQIFFRKKGNMSKGPVCYVKRWLCLLQKTQKKPKWRFNKLGVDFIGLGMPREVVLLGVAGPQKSISDFEPKQCKLKCSEKAVRAA